MIDTTNVTISAPQGRVIAPRRRRWSLTIAVASILVLLVVAVASILPSNWFAETANRRTGELKSAPYARVPASVESVNDRIVFVDIPATVPRYKPAADFLFVTVSAPQQSLLSWVIGLGEPTVDLLTEEDKFGRRTPTQNRQISLQQMRTATQEAQYVALQTAGYDPTIKPGKVIIQDILCRIPAEDRFECIESFPSAEYLQPADTVLAIDGERIGNLKDLADELITRSAGEVIDVRIRRPEVGELIVSVKLSSSPADPDRTVIGFVPFDTATVNLPFNVSVDTGAIGGPSAGLAFTLALVDELTVGDLTGGQNIAVTGTIDLEGNVGPIGGLEQKVHAVQQHGIDTFIVPASQVEFSDPDPENPGDEICRMDCLIKAGKGEVRIIAVATLDEALSELEELGGDPLVPVRTS